MHVDDEARMISEQTTAWPLACYDAYWKEARANTKLSADAKIALSVIIDRVRSTGDAAGWTDYLTDEMLLARAAGCSPEVASRAIDLLQKADLIHVERAWIDDGERRQAHRYALTNAWLDA